MKINLVELYHVNIPLSRRRPGFFTRQNYFLPSWIPGFRQTRMGFYLLKLGTDSGHEGFAAMPAQAQERHSLGPMLANYLMGINPLDINLANQRIQEFSYLGLRNGWMDAAFWDLIGKIKGEPLYKILGGSGGTVRPYASLGDTLGHDQSRIKETVSRVRDLGFDGVKVRIKNGAVNEMADFIGAARQAAGPAMKLMADANQGWPVDILDVTKKWDLDFAVRFAKSVEEHKLYWLEEPLNRGNFEGLAALRKSTSVPIAGGEMNGSWSDFKQMLELGSLDIYQPDAVLIGGTYAGGISVIYRLIQEIRRQNDVITDPAKKIRFCPHTWTTGLGFAVALQLIGVLTPAERSMVEYPFEGHWNPEVWARFIKNGFARDTNGAIPIPDKPGLGVEIDMNVVRKFGKRLYRGTPTTVALNTLKERGWHETMYLKTKKEEQARRFAETDFSGKLIMRPDGAPSWDYVK